MRTSSGASAGVVVVYYICYCTEYGRLDMRRFLMAFRGDYKVDKPGPVRIWDIG